MLRSCLSMFLLAASALPAAAQATAAKSASPAGIQWFGTLESGLRDAERLGRPILLLSAMPSCAGVPGTW